MIVIFRNVLVFYAEDL